MRFSSCFFVWLLDMKRLKKFHCLSAKKWSFTKNASSIFCVFAFTTGGFIRNAMYRSWYK